MKLSRQLTVLTAGLFLASAVPAQDAKPAPQTLQIKTLAAQMRYDTTEIIVSPGTPLKIVFENGDDLPHNLAFCDAGTDVVAMSNAQMEKPEEALRRNWMPDDKRIWAHSKLLNPKETQELLITAPEKPGVYPFVCTFPGHALTMKGELKVFDQGGGFNDLNFKLYLGDWKKLPDFAKEIVHREGPIADRLIQIKLDDYKNEFGVVFNGTVTAPVEGDYEFFLASDDGGRILVDGKKVVEHDGIHPASDIKKGKTKLKKGDHKVEVEYFQAAGQIELYVAWKGPRFEITPLSKWLHPNWKGGPQKKKDEFTGMPIEVKDQAVIYRNFIQGAGNRGIGVGYPDGFNLAWSAEQMSPALLWRGAFIDAARHWTNRGGGHQAPLGYGVIPLPEGTPFSVLESLDSPWPAPQPRAEGFAWKGYHLDAKGAPTFHFEWQGVKISEHYETEGKGIAPDGRIIRVLSLSGGPLPENAWMRIAKGKAEQGADGRWSVDGKYFIKAEGIVHSGDQLLVPLTPAIRVEYQWQN